ncbi:MAG: DNA methyltransferase [Actinomycetota bacterium]
MGARRGTETSSFGVGRRESHDASAFYRRFAAPEVSADDTVVDPHPVADPFVLGDARAMTTVADGSVALVVTSPPYFAGKQYEEELGRDGVPASYGEYLGLLADVFADCVRTLEPGGRIAVNVANLGRKPYRSLAADVIGILQDDLHLLLRGEIVWRKGEGAAGNCAWGSYRSPANPVLRDTTERVVVASKGRFDRARTRSARARSGLPTRATIGADEFMAATLDVWDIPPESARRVAHPAPFPVELPARLIELYTYADDLVLDPFMGSGSTLVAAARLGRRYVAYDLDPTYVGIARKRVTAEGVPDEPETRTGTLLDVAEEMLLSAGFREPRRNLRVREAGAVVGIAATDRAGQPCWFDVVGSFARVRSGLFRTDAAWRAVGRAHALAAAAPGTRIVLLSSHLPRTGSEAELALRNAAGVVAGIVDLGAPDASARLADLAGSEPTRVSGRAGRRKA